MGFPKREVERERETFGSSKVIQSMGSQKRERERERDHVCVCCLIGIYRRGDGGGGILFCFCVVSRNLGTEEEGPTNLAREEIFYYLY